MDEIYEVGKFEAYLIMKHRSPLGKYWMLSDMKFVAIDNSKGYVLTEEFDEKESMLDWLRSEKQ